MTTWTKREPAPPLTPVACTRCKKAGGTLVADGSGGYAHQALCKGAGGVSKGLLKRMRRRR